MTTRIGAIIFCGMIGLELLSCFPGAAAAEACFSASKIYRIHPLHGGADRRDSWAVKGGAFNECVHRAEAAEKVLKSRYPETVYQLSLAATIGCHGC